MRIDSASLEAVRPPFAVTPEGDVAAFVSLTEDALQAPDADVFLQDSGRVEDLESCTSGLIRQAFEEGDIVARRAAHAFLKRCYDLHIQKPVPPLTGNQNSVELLKVRKRVEAAWMAWEKRRIPAVSRHVTYENIADEIKRLWRTHSGYNHEIFAFMKTDANRDQIVKYFTTDYALNMCFYDLIVLSLVGIEEDVRPEVSHNFWDEMGQGNFKRTHVQLYRNLLNYLGVNDKPETFVAALGWEGLSGYNQLLRFALTRQDYFRSIGALAITELSDPEQYAKLIHGCHRVGIGADNPGVLDYYSEHVEVDALHGDGWIDNVIVPILRRYPEQADAIIEGAVMRLNASKDYWDWQFAEMKKMSTKVSPQELS